MIAPGLPLLQCRRVADTDRADVLWSGAELLQELGDDDNEAL